MLADLVRAVSLLGDRAARNTLLLSLAVAVALLVLLFPAVDALARHLVATGRGWLDQGVELLSLAGTLLVVWALFPVLLVAVMGCFLDPVVAATERRYVPGLPPPRVVPWGEAIVGSARFALVASCLNLACLPAYLVPGLAVPVFIALNGWLFGREYLELIASRRFEPAVVDELRRAHKGLVWRTGLVVAVMAAIPVVNLAAPLVGSAYATLRLHKARLLAAPGRRDALTG